MIKLQNILYPSLDFNPTVGAYARLTQGKSNLATNISELTIERNSIIDFATYFNSFSLEKWKKYTNIGKIYLHLDIVGSCKVVLKHCTRENGTTEIKQLFAHTVEANKEPNTVTTVDICYPEFLEKGIVAFDIVTERDKATLKGGYYYTDLNEKDFADVSFAIDICSFKREKFVARNMNILAKTVFAKNSPLKNNFEVFISDNGQSIQLENDCNGKIHVFPNKNLGGAGGFGRSMVEILRSPNYKKFTHIIMMDDDIVFCYETLYRSYIFTKLLKAEYNTAFIGGAMLKSNNPSIQSEAMDRWDVVKNTPIKYNYDITSLAFVLKNEKEDHANHFGWWYCIMPIGVVKSNNLPLPIFIKRDDIEYGVRNGKQFIILNGLCVLHEAFDTKRLGYLEYYYWRNMCILNAIHFPSFDGNTLKGLLKTLFLKYVLRYRYDDANLAFRGVEDFLKGIDWLKSTDAEALNKYVLNYTYKTVDVNDLKINFIHGEYEKTLKHQDNIKENTCGKAPDLSNKKMVLSWLKKANGTRYLKMTDVPLYMYYRVKRIVNYDESTNKAFITQKSIKQAFLTYSNYRRLCKLIDKRYEAVKHEYRYRHNELTNINFWDTYLGLNGYVYPKQDFTKDNIVVSMAEKKQRKIMRKHAKADKKALNKARLFNFVQFFLWFIPKKKKRVLIYNYARTGYGDNLKYIAEELIRQYGNKVEIIWLTSYPESCSMLQEKGIKVVKLNTWQHFLYQYTAKTVITNDSFPQKVRLRCGQLTINTWHAGMNYKKIGTNNLTFENPYRKALFVRTNRQPKVYLAGSQYFIDDTAKSFNYNPKVFVPTGLPRNDLLLQDNTEIKKQIFHYYDLPEDCKIVMYAPTFRKSNTEEQTQLDADMLLDALKNKFGGTWKLFFRRHYFIKNGYALYNKNCIDVSDVDDMNQLLAATDVLVTDYSSSLWDFALTGRPSFVYATDIEQYLNSDRSLSYPMEKWPFPISENDQQLAEAVAAFDNASYQQRIAQHLKDCGSFDKGNASQQVVELIAKKLRWKK